MGLPTQVQKQADAVELYDKKLAEAQAKPPEPEDDTQPPAEEPNKPEVIEPAPPARQDEEAALWRQRFQSLQGMYNSQVPTLQQQVKALSDQLAELQAQQRQPEPTKGHTEGLITKTDVEAFGADLIDVSRRVAQEELSKVATMYEDRINRLTSELEAARRDVGSVAQSQAQSQQEQFLTALSSKLPKWRELQETAECQEFLGTHIPGTRTEWNDALVSAAARFDIKAVTEVFEQFFARYPKYAPAKPRQQTQANQAELSRQVTPSRSSGGSQTPTAKRAYTGHEYEQESMRMVRLAQQGKHDEAARLEAELNAALADGRVR